MPAGPAPMTATSNAPRWAVSLKARSLIGVTVRGVVRRTAVAELGTYGVAGGDHGQAGAHVRLPVHRHQTVEAHADPAEQPPRTAAETRRTPRPDPLGQQRRADGLAGL